MSGCDAKVAAAAKTKQNKKKPRTNYTIGSLRRRVAWSRSLRGMNDGFGKGINNLEIKNNKKHPRKAPMRQNQWWKINSKNEWAINRHTKLHHKVKQTGGIMKLRWISWRTASFDYETQTAINCQIWLASTIYRWNKNKQQPPYHVLKLQATNFRIKEYRLAWPFFFYQHVCVSMKAAAGQTGRDADELN